jgi:hypothetical protein
MDKSKSGSGSEMVKQRGRVVAMLPLWLTNCPETSFSDSAKCTSNVHFHWIGCRGNADHSDYAACNG